MTELICQDCLSVALPKKVKQGSTRVESMLWMVFPFGLPYTIWRMLTKKKACRHCNSKNLVAVDTPLGKRLVDKYFNQVLQMPSSESESEFGSNFQEKNILNKYNNSQGGKYNTESFQASDFEELKTNKQNSSKVEEILPAQKNIVTIKPEDVSNRRDPEIKINQSKDEW